MKYQSALRYLIPLIFLFALFASAAGLFYSSSGEPFSYTNHRGENVMINGHGLYFYDTVSSAAQTQVNDLITLLVGLPLLAISTWLAFRGSLRGRLLLTGSLAFFLYTYLSMATLAAYNMLFLMYVALFALSLYAFILSMLSFDIPQLPAHFSPKLRRGWVAGILFAIGGFLVLAWLGRIIPELINPEVPAALENTTTRVIQALDLALVVPLAILGGILLLRDAPLGYLLASVAILKGLTMALAVSAMGINMTLAGVPESTAILAPFLVLTVFNAAVAVMLLRSIDA